MADPIEFEMNSDAFAANLVALGDAALPACAAVLYARGEAVMARSKDEFVPVDEGILRSSGYVVPPVITGDEAIVVLGYGGPAQAYALKQHDDATLHHPSLERQRRGETSAQPGTDHYLAKPLTEELPDLPAHLADGIAAAAERVQR